MSASEIENSPVATDDGNARRQDPYVGLRPYEEDDRWLFFGRDRDATLLRNKLFSSPLMLLYAPSGVGKTSLLQTLIIPDIRDQGVHVLYFDHWVGLDPVFRLKTVLLESAGITPAAEHARVKPLVAVVRMASKKLDSTVVLLLDQFEQFLVEHAERLDPLRKELGALVRSDADAHVVLSLREEFLAALDDFRPQIPTLFQSTFHLERLRGADAIKAIKRPAELLGRSVEDRLVEALLEALVPTSKLAGGTAASPVTQGLDLPFLQIVCERLWEEAEKRDLPKLTFDLYRELGQRKGIIRKYIETITSTFAPWQRDNMAKVVKFLAPPSGMKMTYSVDVLKDFTGLSEQQIMVALDHLCKKKVVRDRKGGAERTFELYHDAFIPDLSSWAARQFRRRKAMRRGLVVSGLAVILGMALAGGIHVIERLEEHNETVIPLEMLRNQIERKDARSTFDRVAQYLWEKGDEDSITKLVGLLKSNEDLIPDGYGIEDNVPTGFVDVERYPDWPLTVVHSGIVPLTSSILNYHWQSMAIALAESWGIPMPFAIKLKTDATLRESDLLVRTPGLYKEERDGPTRDEPQDDVEAFSPNGNRGLNSRPPQRIFETALSLSFEPGDSLLSEENIPSGRLRNFFDSYNHEWRRLSDFANDGSWWLVPNWTRPIWKVGGAEILPVEMAIAFIVAKQLIDEPHKALSHDAVVFLLDQARDAAPRTVEQALAARRGVDGVWSDLVEVLRKKVPIIHLMYILDELADHRNLSSSEVAKKAIDNLGYGSDIVAKRLPESLPEVKVDQEYIEDQGDQIGERIRNIYYDAGRWLPSEPPIRIYFSPGLSKVVAPDGSNLSLEIREGLARVRGDFFGLFGFTAPSVLFREEDFETSNQAFLVRVAHEVDTYGEDELVTTAPDQAVSDILYDVGWYLSELREWWLTADKVEILLADVPQPLRSWLEESYSLTELKLILRAMIATAEENLFDETQPYQTLEALPELLGSLVFWANMEDADRTRKIAEYLRETQRARLGKFEPAAPAPPDIVMRVREGIRSLDVGAIGEAQSAFKLAVEVDATAASSAFLRLYGTHARQKYTERVEQLCMLPELGKFTLTSEPSMQERYMIEGYLERLQKDTRLERQIDFQLCLLWSYLAEDHWEQAATLANLLLQKREGEQWNSRQDYFLAYQLIDTGAAIFGFGEAPMLESAQVLLENIFVRLEQSEAERTFSELLGVCESRSDPSDCESLLSSVAEIPNESFWVPLELAFYKIDFVGTRTALDQALSLFERAGSVYRSQSAPGREDLPAWFDFGRARALLMLDEKGNRVALMESKALFEKLLQSVPDTRSWPGHSDIRYYLADIYIRQNNLGQAERIVKEGLIVRPNDVLLSRQLYHLQLAQKDPWAAWATAKQFLAGYQDLAGTKQEVGETDWRFMASVAGLLVQAENFETDVRRFLITNHMNRDYVRMIYYWALRQDEGVGDADEILRTRWNEIARNVDEWDRRLSRGDVAAWSEMLVGYYVGEVRRERIFDPLKSLETFQGSKLANLGLPLAALRCEAFFYDALLQDVGGDPGARNDLLQKVIDTEYRSFLEYHMANYLLDGVTEKPN